MRIRIVSCPPGGFIYTLHPKEDRLVRVGDEFDVDDIYSDGRVSYRACRNALSATDSLTTISPRYIEILDKETATSDKLCKCDTQILLRTGCQCGGI